MPNPSTGLMPYDQFDYDDFEREISDIRDDCEHEHYDIDILDGRATCDMCGHHWFASKEQCDAEEKRIEDYDRMVAEWEAEEASEKPK